MQVHPDCFGIVNREPDADDVDAVQFLYGPRADQHLAAGLNLVSFSKDFDPALTSHGLAAVLGDDLESVTRLDPAAGTPQTTHFVGGAPAGPDFAIVPDAGYLVRMASPAIVEVQGLTLPREVNLDAGVNLVGLHLVRGGESAFQLLERIALVAEVQSLLRFDVETGRFEAAVMAAQGPAGVDFPLAPEFGYLLFMGEPLAAFTMPELPGPTF